MAVRLWLTAADTAAVGGFFVLCVLDDIFVDQILAHAADGPQQGGLAEVQKPANIVGVGIKVQKGQNTEDQDRKGEHPQPFFHQKDTSFPVFCHYTIPRTIMQGENARVNKLLTI